MAITWFVATTGSDTNGGSSDGAAKASGSANANWSSGVVTITLPGGTDLSTVVPGDSIRLATATGGVRSSDTFEIASVNDGADTVDVTSAPTNSGTNQNWAIGGSLASIQRAVDLVRAGETVNVKATATYSPSSTISIASGAAGGGTTPIVFRGFTSTVTDGGIVTIDGGSLAANVACVTHSGSFAAHHVWKNFRFQNASGTGMGFDAAAGGTNVHFRRCRFNNNGGRGCRIGGGIATFVHCYAHNNGNHGFETGTSNAVHIATVAYSNIGDGINAAGGGVLYRCASFSNTEDNYEIGGAVNVCIDCTEDGDADDSDRGFHFSGAASTQIQVLVNCIVYDAATGVLAATNVGDKRVSFNNLVNGNTTAYSAFATESGEVTSAPGFVNESGQDYGIEASSPARSAGLDPADNPWGLTFTGRSADIGAVVAQDAGGGGGSRGQILSGGRL